MTGTPKRRVGKTRAFKWEVLTDEEKKSLENRDLNLHLVYPDGVIYHEIDFTIEFDKLKWTWEGKAQRRCGKYSLVLWENYGKVGQTCCDKREFVELVPYDTQEDGDFDNIDEIETITIDSGNLYEGGGGGSVDVVDNLTSTSTTSALSANQGRVLKGLVDAKQDALLYYEEDSETKEATIDTIGAFNITCNIANYNGSEIATQDDLDGFATKATTLSGYGITNAYTKTEVDGIASAKADASNTYTKTEVNALDEVIANELTSFETNVSENYYNNTTSDERFAPISHTHTIANVTGLSDALASKLSSTAYTTYTISSATTLQITSAMTNNEIIYVHAALNISSISAIPVEVVLFVDNGVEVTLPSGTKVIGTIDTSSAYCVSILNGCAVIGNFS